MKGNGRKRTGIKVCLLIFVVLLLVVCVNYGRNIWVVSGRIWNMNGYPDALVELARNNPEAVEFVLDYPQYGDAEQTIDLTGELVAGEIPLFLQWDKRWGYECYGNNFLAVNGCGPTCLAMVYCGLTGDGEQNPYSIACLSAEKGFYVENAGTSWTMMTELARELGLTVHQVVYDEPHIRAFLQKDYPIICVLGPGDFTDSGHFIVLTGLDEQGRVIVNDPNSPQNSNQVWELERIIPQMKNLWGYSRG
ncbi:MAG: C39 family peptidase [Lachnospiraceae bacterium]|nr:C39 family peptidase [Lachnospiraceae bacterium]